MSTELVRIKQILREAGATPASLARLETQMRQALRTEVAQYESFLRLQSSAGLARLVEFMRRDDQYVLGPYSLPQSGVPQGALFDFTLDRSTIFPGTRRKITVYVPAQYKADRPACVYVGLDGLAFELATVFDNLIHRQEMPVTIAIGVAPGIAESAHPASHPRFNRSYEFDALNDNLARFLLEEVLPQVEREVTPSGLPIQLSKDPNDRAAGGLSSGGIGAFTLAWERPDAFRRVFSAIGSFVGMRGADRYPVLIRKTEPKPLRIFMQDGCNDGMDGVLGEVGDWWMGNQAMQRALKFSGYQIEHVWGEGSHGRQHGTAIFPDAMRWLWKDWPQAVIAGKSENVFLEALLQPDEIWQCVAGDHHSNGALAADPEGDIVFYDTARARMHKLSSDGSVRNCEWLGDICTGLAFGPDGRAYVSQGSEILAYGPKGQASTIAEGLRARHVLLAHDGKLYLTETGAGDDGGTVWLVRPSGEKTLLDTGLNHPTGIAISPDELWLAVAESKTHWGYTYRVNADGSLQDKQRFYWFHVPDSAEDSGAGPLAMDRDGTLYAATRAGVQVFDRNGRCRAILPVPGGHVTGLAFGGARFETLYVSCADHKIYQRKLKVAGATPWNGPLEVSVGFAG